MKSAKGIRSLTRVFPERRRQLEQCGRRRSVVRELQQRSVEHEHEHRGSSGERFAIWPVVGGSRATLQRPSFGVNVLTGKTDKYQQSTAASSTEPISARTWPSAPIPGTMPKTHNNLYEQIIDFDNLWNAYLEARKGKRYRREVSNFATNLEENLINLHNHLVWETWQPGRAREFRIFEPKQRDIQAPPFVDRIVHHALVRVVEPLFENRFIDHSYACRKGKGAQAAVKKLQSMMREAGSNSPTPYAIKADIKSYFATINHDVMFGAIGRVVSCKKTLALWRRIAGAYGHDDSIGQPVGALTSQLGANIHLDQLDHRVVDDMGLGKNYVRYMDDFVVIAPNKRSAQLILVALTDEVTALGLVLNPKTSIFPAARGVDFCGYRTWPDHILPRKRNIKKAKARFRLVASQYRAGLAGLPEARQQVASFLAYTKHCDAHETVRNVLNDFILTRS